MNIMTIIITYLCRVKRIREESARTTKAGISFVIEPHIRFKGQVGEQATMFFLDPCGNAVEFKAFANPESLFAK
jgi:extradiol dioxygenase family protein